MSDELLGARSAVSKSPCRDGQPAAEDTVGITNGISAEYPLLWGIAERYDFAERLGGCTEPLWVEVDAALREIWNWRQRSPVPEDTPR